MVRIVLGVISGFVVWSIVWLGSDQLLQDISPAWLGAYSQSAEKSIVNGTDFEIDSTIALITLIRSILTSLFSGYVAALVAGESRRTGLILGVILLAVGIAVEVMTWRLNPVWYHALFLLLLIPVTMLGASLRRPAATAR